MLKGGHKGSKMAALETVEENIDCWILLCPLVPQHPPVYRPPTKYWDFAVTLVLPNIYPFLFLFSPLQYKILIHNKFQ